MTGTIMSNIDDVFSGMKSAQLVMGITCLATGISLYAISQSLDMNRFFEGMMLMSSAGMIFVSMACFYELYYL